MNSLTTERLLLEIKYIWPYPGIAPGGYSIHYTNTIIAMTEIVTTGSVETLHRPHCPRWPHRPAVWSFIQDV